MDTAHMTEEARDSQTLQLSDGTTIGFAEYGSSDGFPVLVFHGLPGSRFEAELWSDDASQHNVRIIAPDRPGIGLSSRIANRTVADYPEQMASLVEHLGLTSFGIVGASGGGPYAFACAARKDLLPGLETVGIVAGLGPRDLPNTSMSLSQKLRYAAMDYLPGGLIKWLWDINLGNAARNPDQSVLETKLQKAFDAEKGPDKELYDERTRSIFINSIRGALIQSSQGYVDDAAIMSSTPWGFSVADIKDVTVKLWYGDKDGLTPAATGKAIADTIPNASFTCFEGESHIASYLKHRPEILNIFTSDTARTEVSN